MGQPDIVQLKDETIALLLVVFRPLQERPTEIPEMLQADIEELAGCALYRSYGIVAH